MTKNFVENKTANILLHLGSRSSSCSNSSTGNSPIDNDSPLHYGEDGLSNKSALPKSESQIDVQEKHPNTNGSRNSPRKRVLHEVSDENDDHPSRSSSQSQGKALTHTVHKTKGLSRRRISLSKLPSLSELSEIVPKHSKISDLIGKRLLTLTLCLLHTTAIFMAVLTCYVP